MGEEEGPGGQVIKLMAIVTLNTFSGPTKLSGDIGKSVLMWGRFQT
jgi:hypothetical protein